MLTSFAAREKAIIDNILKRYGNLVNFATQRITDKASTGQAAYNSMAMDLETQSFVHTSTVCFKPHQQNSLTRPTDESN